MVEKFPDCPPDAVGKCALHECHEEMEKLQAEKQELELAQTDRELANHTYDPTSEAPEGFERLDPETPEGQAALKNLGLHDGTNTLTRMDDGDFQAEVYKHIDPTTGLDNYKVAFRGTQSGADWGQNLMQGMGWETPYYAQAAEIAETIETFASGRVSYTGHSLGGGLASVAAGGRGAGARTFNAAGLHEDTIAEYGGQHGTTQAYYLTSDPLNWNQDRISMMPQAVGTRHGFDKVHDWTGEDLAPVHAWEERDYAWYEHASGASAKDRFAAAAKAHENRALRFHGTEELGEAMAKEQAVLDAEIEALKRGPCAPYFD